MPMDSAPEPNRTSTISRRRTRSGGLGNPIQVFCAQNGSSRAEEITRARRDYLHAMQNTLPGNAGSIEFETG